MRPFILMLILVAALCAKDKKNIDLAGKYGPFPGVDKVRLEKLEKVKIDRLKEQEKLKIELQRLELDLKELLLEGANLPEFWKNCSKRGEIWAKIQYALIKADAKRKEILSSDEWDKYLIWKLNFEAKRTKKEKAYHSEYKEKIVKPLKKIDGCAYIVEGTIEYYKQGKVVAVVDYGDGTCDNLATKVADGETYEFELDK